MDSKAITQHYWERQSQAVQPPKAADKLRDERKQPSFSTILKKQSTEDRLTVVLSCLAILFGLATVVTQIGIWQGW